MTPLSFSLRTKHKRARADTRTRAKLFYKTNKIQHTSFKIYCQHITAQLVEKERGGKKNSKLFSTFVLSQNKLVWKTKKYPTYFELYNIIIANRPIYHFEQQQTTKILPRFFFTSLLQHTIKPEVNDKVSIIV